MERDAAMNVSSHTVDKVQNGHEIVDLCHRLSPPNPLETGRGRIDVICRKDLDKADDESGCEVGP